MISKYDLLCRGRGNFVTWLDQRFYDCQGGCLPKNGVDVRLMAFLNKVDEEYDDNLIITSAHRCFQHNLFSYMLLAATGKDPRVIRIDSKHVTVSGLEKCCAVDFLILPKNAEQLQNAIDNEFKRLFNEVFKGRYEFEELFWLKVYDRDEGRDFDNKHNQPYIHIQLRDGMENY